MKRLYLVLAISILLCSMSSCTQEKLQEAKDGLNMSVAQLPNLSDFDVVTIMSGESSATASGETCYYAQAYVVLGTSLPEEKALEVYVDALESLGWIIERSDLERTRVLSRGMYERITVSHGSPGWAVESNEDYKQAKNIYPTVILVVVDFMLPGRERC